MGTKNNTESFVSSVISSSTTTFCSSNYQYTGTGSHSTQPSLSAATVPPPSSSSPQQSHYLLATSANLSNSSSGGGRVVKINSSSATSSVKTSPPSVTTSPQAVGKHRLPMQLSRPPTTGSIGVSVITPAVCVNQSSQKEAQFKHHQQHMQQKIQSVRNVNDGYSGSSSSGINSTNNIINSRNNAAVTPYSNSNEFNTSSPTTGGVTITPVNSVYMPGKSSKLVTPSPTASMVYSHTQHLPKYISSSRFLVNTDKGDVYINDDGSMSDMPDKRNQYCKYLPPDFQYVLQDHSYSLLLESPPTPPTPPTPVQQKTTINGLNRLSSSVTPTKVTLNNNRVVNVGGGGSRSNGQQQQHHHHHGQPQSSNNVGSMNSYSSVSTIVNSVAANLQNNSATSVIALNPKKNALSNSTPATASLTPLSGVPKSLLKIGALDKRDESDLSEDDRITDPHGEETETAPEAEGEEESVTRCICDFQHDDGYMISCDKCLAWQHVDCMGIDWHHIPDEYQCEKCQPRYIDKKRAVELQKKKIAEKLCVGVNDDSDSSDAPAPNSRSATKNQTTKRKYKGRRTQNKRKNAKESAKETKPKRNLGAASATAGAAKKRQLSEPSMHSPPISPSPSSNVNMTAEKKKQLLMERKQMLLEKKQITKKRSMRKQAQTSKRNLDKSKADEDLEHRSIGNAYIDKEEDTGHSIHQVREWVDRYEEAVTNHYSQELRARLSAVQVNGVHSDLKYTTSLRSVEKCKTSLLSTGGKIVLATCSLSSNQPIIELRGKYMWTGAGSFKQNNISPSTPYVFYYRLPKQDIEICVDCRTYGNFARFVRRSCKPNSELRHCIRKTSLHLYIIATQALKKNSEILIGHFSPETANSCVCGSPESCTAAKTPYPPPTASRYSRESHLIRSSSPMISEMNARNRKTPALNSEKGKKRVKEEKKKLTKEKRRGRRRSPRSASESNSDQGESSSRDQSPSAPTRLTVSMWAKPAINNNSAAVSDSNRGNIGNEHNDNNSSNVSGGNNNANNGSHNGNNNNNNNNNVDTEEDDNSDNESHSENEMRAASPTNVDNDDEPARTPTMAENECNNADNATTSASDSEGQTPTATAAGTCTPASGTHHNKQNAKSNRSADYARKEKQQLDMPLFFSTPNNHKLTREEKKIQAIMKAFEQMEKTVARKQENQKHRRESTSDAEACGKKTPCRKGVKSSARKSIDDTKGGGNGRNDEDAKSRKNSQTEDEDDDDECKPSVELFNHKLNSMKDEPKTDDAIVDYGHVTGATAKNAIKTELDEESDDPTANADLRSTDNEDDENKPNCANDIKKIIAASPKKFTPTGYTSPNHLSPIKLNNRTTTDKADETDGEPKARDTGKRKRNEAVTPATATTRKNAKLRSPCKTRAKPTPKARAVSKPKVLRGKKRKSGSGDEDSADAEAGVISERTRSALQRQRKTNTAKTASKDDKKNSVACSPAKFKKAEDAIVSPFSTPPKARERLDSSSSSGGTPPTPVSDTCLLVAAAVGHLTDFKFPNTKKELMNAWFKEEKKPSPDEETPNKLTNQEGNNEYAKKRWLRQAISEEGDTSGSRPEEAVSPNGDYGGPLKKRRFARESMSEPTSCGSPTSVTFAGSNQMSFDDDDEDIVSPDASLYRASEGDGAEAYHPTQLQNEAKPTIAEEEKPAETKMAPMMADTDTDNANPTTAAAVAAIVEKTTAAVAAIVEKIDFDPEADNAISSCVGSVLSSVLSAVASVEAQPPPPPRCVTPPPTTTEAKKQAETASPPISKKKLSLTEYKQRKSTTTIATTVPPTCTVSVADIAGDVVQEVPALAAAPPPTIDPVERSSSRSSITSSSCSEEEDNSHVASAQVIARSLMIESRHLSYGPQASALFNSIRSGSLGSATSQTFNSKTGTGPPLPRENLADRLKREFDVHVQEDETEKNKAMPPPLSPIKIHVQVPSELPLAQKDLHLRLKKSQPPPPPPPLPMIPPPLLPPLPEPPQLFAPYYPYAVPRVPQFFVAPPPPPPPVPPPLLPPPPPPPPPQ